MGRARNARDPDADGEDAYKYTAESSLNPQFARIREFWGKAEHAAQPIQLSLRFGGVLKIAGGQGL